MTDAMYNAIYNAVKEATAHVVPESEISKKIVKHVFKACSDPEILQLPWQHACKEVVERAMVGYCGAAGDLDWFFDVDLVPAFMVVAYELVQRSGASVQESVVYEVVQAEFEAELDRRLLEKSLYDVCSKIWKEEKVSSKVAQCLHKSYWTAFEEVLQDGTLQREMLYGLDQKSELRRVESFTRQWLDDGIGRAWVIIEGSQAGINQQIVMKLIKMLLAPFGDTHPYSCLPGGFIDNLGRPPQDWAYIRICSAELFRSWSGEGAKKKRRTGPKRKSEGDEFEQAILGSTEEAAEEAF